MTAQARPHNVTATGTVFTGPCTFRGCTIFSTAGATVTIYDNTAASGTVLAKFVLGANGLQNVDIVDGVRCDTGVHLVATAAIEGNVRIG
ncbi:MAG TPA: hypothetical protein VGX25_04040 [Actinophytocola sp.]|uniref:hypothetical protein n=1 Tax=Actinophytocola sp. TaxID=1872138 RepID=UPI002DDCB159|nr:hypothetical protein [Actinophytocola sp.]HEV2778549.1 hypothetical protein [Actinophytocola sp.]